MISGGGTSVEQRHNSSIYVLNYKSRIDCKNRMGQFSSGRKVAGITFTNNLEFLVATNDSRLRLYSVFDCLQMVKFKGHVNENLQLIPSYDSKHRLIAVGSEDGAVFIYDRKELNENVLKKDEIIGVESPTSPVLKTQVGQNPYARQKNRSCESFIPFPSKDVNRREKA